MCSDYIRFFFLFIVYVGLTRDFFLANTILTLMKAFRCISISQMRHNYCRLENMFDIRLYHFLHDFLAHVNRKPKSSILSDVSHLFDIFRYIVAIHKCYTWVWKKKMSNHSVTKCHLISKANFLVLIWTKNQTKSFFDFCPHL